MAGWGTVWLVGPGCTAERTERAEAQMPHFSGRGYSGGCGMGQRIGPGFYGWGLGGGFGRGTGGAVSSRLPPGHVHGAWARAGANLAGFAIQMPRLAVHPCGMETLMDQDRLEAYGLAREAARLVR